MKDIVALTVVVVDGHAAPPPVVAQSTEHPAPSTKVCEFDSHEAAEQLLAAAPSQAVQDPSTTPTISSIMAAQEAHPTPSTK